MDGAYLSVFKVMHALCRLTREANEGMRRSISSKTAFVFRWDCNSSLPEAGSVVFWSTDVPVIGLSQLQRYSNDFQLSSMWKTSLTSAHKVLVKEDENIQNVLPV